MLYGYSCCETTTDVVYTDNDGKWGIEKGNWCGINVNVNQNNQITITGNPLANKKLKVQLHKMSDNSLMAKAKKIKTFSNAIWLDSIKNMERSFLLNKFLLSDYIDAYKSQPVVLIVESDSIATMVTNLDSTPACCDLERYYIDGHGYIIQKFGILPHVAMYLGILDTFFCLGWDDNRQKAETEWNPCPDKKRYLEAIHKDFTSACIPSVYFVCDTLGNGRKVDHKHPEEWCNQIGYALALMFYIGLIHFRWMPRFNGYCGHETAMKPVPEAGRWLQKHFEQGI
ncbi:putative cellulase [Neocallimastix sp. 'constans']